MNLMSSDDYEFRVLDDFRGQRAGNRDRHDLIIVAVQH